MKILIVDDERLSLARTVRIVTLATENDEIRGFSLPSEALKAVREEDFLPDIAFLDIEMPVTDGIAVARELKKLNPKINIIFTTGYAQYMKAALDMFASGYILKPVEAEDVAKQLKNLRYSAPVKKSLYVRVFGNFDLLKNGVPVRFYLQKAKETLAYLVHKNGTSVTKKELCAVLFEDMEYSARIQDYFVKIVRSLKKTLSEIGAPDLLVQGRNSYSVNTELFDSELSDGSAEAHHGEYMSQYAWAEGYYLPNS